MVGQPIPLTSGLLKATHESLERREASFLMMNKDALLEG